MLPRTHARAPPIRAQLAWDFSAIAMLELSTGDGRGAAALGDVDASVAPLDRDNDGVAAAAGSAAGFLYEFYV